MKIFKRVLHFAIRPFLFYLYSKAALKICQELSPHFNLKKSSKVLDLGCGLGFVGYTLAKELKVEVVGTDVRDVREVDLPFAFTNGKNLPFADCEFDAVLISYVLHHTKNARKILKEANRVCKGKIFIYEDTPQTFVHKMSCIIHGFSYGSFFGLEDKCKFRSRREWLNIFSSLGFKIIHSSKIDLFNPIHTTKRTLFILAN